jgi:TPR repeat protein
MKRLAHTALTFTLVISALCLAGMSPAHAAARGKKPPMHTARELCPADAVFQSRVDEKLNSLNLEDLTAASDKGNTDATVLLGMRYTAGALQNYEKAVSLFQAAADKNNADGEYYMAVAYLNGFGVPKDEAQAAKWFKRSADRGHAVAQYWFGEMTAKGRGGLTEDWKAALPFFKKGAHGAVPNAIVEIGIMFHYGLGGLPVDYEESAACYRVASKHGSQLAQYNLALMINDGKVKWQPGDPTPRESKTPDVPVESAK